MKALSTAAVSLTLIAAAFSAQAQSSVNIYGTLDLSVGSYQLAGQRSVKRVDSGDMVTSYIGFGGSEDLGGGLKANFAVESFIGVDNGAAGRFTGDAFWSRASYVGLSGSFGSIKVGRTTNLAFVSHLLFNSFADSFGFVGPIIHRYIDARGPAASIAGDTAWNNSVTYVSPSINGLSLGAQGALTEGNGKRNVGLNALYFTGPFSATLTWQSVGAGLGGAKETSAGGGLAYDFGPVKLFGQYTSIDDDANASKVKIWDLSASIPVASSGKVMLAVGRSKIGGGSTHTTSSVGYDYALSKRSDLYAVYMNDKITGLSSGNTFAVGLKHSF